MSSLTCKNCDEALTGKYCANCGQPADVHRYTLKHIGHEVFHSMTHTDKSALDFLWQVIVRPGHIAKDLIEGKRQRYFNLFTFFVIVTAIYALAVNTSHYYEIMGRQDIEQDKNIPKEARLLMGEAYNLMIHNNKVLLFSFPPITALLTILFFRKKRYNYAEHLVYNTIMLPVYLLLIGALAQLVWIDEELVKTTNRINQVAIITYLSVGNRQLFGERWFPTIVKSVLIRFIQLFIVWLLALLIVCILRLFR